MKPFVVFSLIRLKEGENTYTISQCFYEQSDSVSNNGSRYFMNSKSLEFINEVSNFFRFDFVILKC